MARIKVPEHMVEGACVFHFLTWMNRGVELWFYSEDEELLHFTSEPGRAVPVEPKAAQIALRNLACYDMDVRIRVVLVAPTAEFYQ